MPAITEDFVKSRLQRLVSKSKDVTVRDTKLTGFQVRARKLADDTISRAFFYEYQVPGSTKRKKISIGLYPAFSVDQARERAAEMARDLEKGKDPVHVRAEAIAAEVAKPTIETAWKAFKDEHMATLAPTTVRDYEGRFRRVIKPSFKGRLVASITRAEVKALPANLVGKRKKIDINRGISVLSIFMNFCIDKEWRDDNPCIRAKRFEESVNMTWLDEKQLPKFVQELVKVEGPVGDLCRFLAVTGWRITSARKLTWEQVNLSRLEVEIANTTTKRNATALSTDAAALIDAQPHRIGYVFSRSRGKHPIEYNAVLWALADICAAAGLQKITPHWLRRTLATHAAIGGANVAELMHSMGWSTPGMAMRYVKRSESLARKGVERNAGIINLNRKPVAEVVKIG